MSVVRFRPKAPKNGLFYAVVTQLVECHLAKVDVASSNLVYRSKMAPWPRGKARVCKTLIPGPIPGGASRKNTKFIAWCSFFAAKFIEEKFAVKYCMQRKSMV